MGNEAMVCDANALQGGRYRNGHGRPDQCCDATVHNTFTTRLATERPLS